MADCNVSQIHLVNPSPKPQPAKARQSNDPKDIAKEALAVVRECKGFLFCYRAECEALTVQMGNLLDRLEVYAIRAMKRQR